MRKILIFSLLTVLGGYLMMTKDGTLLLSGSAGSLTTKAHASGEAAIVLQPELVEPSFATTDGSFPASTAASGAGLLEDDAAQYRVEPLVVPGYIGAQEPEEDLSGLSSLEQAIRRAERAYERLVAQSGPDSDVSEELYRAKVQLGDLYSQRPVNQAAERHSLDQGNDSCAATLIPSLPFADSGTTAGRVNNFTPSCATSTAPDVIYQYTAVSSGPHHFILCGSSFDCLIEVRTGGACPGSTVVTCNDDMCSLQSTASANLVSGTTYYIIVDGFSSNSGSYTLQVREGCGITHQLGDIVECAEVVDTSHARLDCNGGCNNLAYGGTVNFQYVTCPATMAGECFTYSRGGFDQRDYDTYAFSVAETCTVSVDFMAEFGATVELQRFVTCPGTLIASASAVLPCSPTTLTAPCLAPGQYVVRVYPDGTDGVPTPLPYRVSIRCARCFGCDIQCQPWDIVECYEWVDSTNHDNDCNGGCNNEGPDTWQEINCGETVCGSVFTYQDGGLNFRDTDFFRFSIADSCTLGVSVIADFPLRIFIGSGSCAFVSYGTTTAAACTPTVLTVPCLPPGSYVMWVGPSVFTGIPTPKRYHARIGCSPCNPNSCVSVCPPYATLECAETVDSSHARLDCNGGCNNASSGGINRWQQIQCGETVCGRAFTYTRGTTNLRDTDWYEFTLPDTAMVTWYVNANFVPSLFIINGWCPPSVITSLTGVRCGQDSLVTTCLPPGTYYAFVAPSTTTGIPVPKYYEARLTCIPCTACDVLPQVGDIHECNEYVEPAHDSTDCNGGCNNSSFGGVNTWQNIECGQTVSGIGFTYINHAGSNARDTDWYRFSVLDSATIRISCEARFAPRLFLFNYACPTTTLGTISGAACTPVTLQVNCIPPGTYVMWVGPTVFTGIPVAQPYRATLECLPCNCPTPLNVVIKNLPATDDRRLDFIAPVSGYYRVYRTFSLTTTFPAGYSLMVDAPAPAGHVYWVDTNPSALYSRYVVVQHCDPTLPPVSGVQNDGEYQLQSAEK